jgi:hypothetical protein
MKNWIKVFQVKKMKIKPIYDSNLKLQGLIFDNKVFLLDDALFELFHDKTKF